MAPQKFDSLIWVQFMNNSLFTNHAFLRIRIQGRAASLQPFFPYDPDCSDSPCPQWQGLLRPYCPKAHSTISCQSPKARCPRGWRTESASCRKGHPHWFRRMYRVKPPLILFVPSGPGTLSPLRARRQPRHTAEHPS